MDRNGTKRAGAFTLTELLVVMAVISVLMASAFSGLSSVAKGSRLTQGGNLVADLLKLARENAISKSALTALLVVQKSGSQPGLDNRLVCVLERPSGSTEWTPVTKWHILPDGVVADMSGSNFAPPSSIPTLGALTYGGSRISSYVFQVFRSDGSIETAGGNPPALKLVEGYMNGDELVPTSKAALSGNFYTITLNAFTGLAKSDRP